jgi:two-component system OmpR family response regulator
MRVLIADDNRDTVLTLGILLRSEGHEVQLVENGEQALAEADQFRPDVVLLDIEMPGRSGFEVAQELSRRHGRECPVLVAVTAHSEPEDRRSAEMSGFHHFVPKPYRCSAVLQLIESFAHASRR